MQHFIGQENEEVVKKKEENVYLEYENYNFDTEQIIQQQQREQEIIDCT